MKKKLNLRSYIRLSALSVLVGVLSGLAATVFLTLLDLTTQAREANLWVIWLLPAAGFCIGWVYYHFGRDVAGGNNLILEEIHNPKNIIPLRMAPFILFGTIITHLFGGSAGREGTAIQIGASLSDQLSRHFKVETSQRRNLLMAATGASFGAAIGAPWAGVIFGMEVIQVGRPKLMAWLECLIASFTAYYVAITLQAPHSAFPKPDIDPFSLTLILSIGIAGVIFGLGARLFASLTHLVERINSRFIPYPPLKPFIAGLILVVLYKAEGSYQFAGLGIPVIQNAMEYASSFTDPVLKLILSAITIGSGFKGGEFIPLVFIGTTIGSALSQMIPVSIGLLSALGFAAVFGAAANTPIACTIMALELFGPQIGPYALIACLVSYSVSGRKGIYRSQI